MASEPVDSSQANSSWKKCILTVDSKSHKRINKDSIKLKPLHEPKLHPQPPHATFISDESAKEMSLPNNSPRFDSSCQTPGVQIRSRKKVMVCSA